MARYIDADEALRMMQNSKQDNPCDDSKKAIWGIAHDCCIDCVRFTHTADVVPRAEVEELKAENERLTDLVKELQGYNEAWVEDNGKLRKKNKNLAMEIFEEIDRIIFGHIIPNDCAIISLVELAKLKKKYTEGGDQA